jgi:hypothetical protein
VGRTSNAFKVTMKLQTFLFIYVFWSLVFEPTDLRTATVKDLCLFTRGTGLWNLG